MAVDFYLADSIDEAANADDYVSFDETIHEFLCKNNYIGPAANLLLGLDPYGDKIFTPGEVKELQYICIKLINLYSQDEIVEFAHKLMNICSLSLTTGKSIVALGD